jgi:hypothetical protein
MGFVNAYLTEEEKEDFEKSAMKNPIRPFRTLKPLRWTIDRENDMRLIWVGVDIDYYDEHYFVFLWKGETHVVSLVKDTSGIKNCALWSRRTIMSDYTFPLDAPFVNDLRNALMAYKYDGSIDALNENSRAICDF